MKKFLGTTLVVFAAGVTLAALGAMEYRFVSEKVARRAAVSDEARSDRDARILAWIVERNPQATIKDFSDFPRFLVAESQAAGIDFRIILAMIDKESQFNPRAVGSSGEVGLMQVLPATGAAVAKRLEMPFEFPVKNKAGAYTSLGTLGDAKDNVRIGVAYLGQQVKRFGGVSPVAIRAYNRHPDNARQNRPWDRYAEDVGLRLVVLVQEFPR